MLIYRENWLGLNDVWGSRCKTTYKKLGSQEFSDRKEMLGTTELGYEAG